MKNVLIKDSVKEIKNTYKRFISILLMAFLGVGFFAGIRATSPDMVATIDKQYKAQNVFDLEVISTLGLTNEDIEEIEKIQSIEEVVGTYEKDARLEIDNTEIIVKLMCQDDINKPIIIEGRKPEKANECVVEENFLIANNKKIGDTITLEVENTTNDEGEEIEFLEQKELEIVGTAKSPLYLSRDRGTSSLGAGKINYYMYISKDNIKAKDIYTQIYIKILGANEFETSSKKYEECVEKVQNEIEKIKEQRQNARYNSLIEKATNKVNEAQKTFDTEKNDAQNKINEAEKEIQDGKNKIANGENEIKQNAQKANTEFYNAQVKINSAKQQVQQSEEQLKNQEQEANAKFVELEQQKQELSNNIVQIEQGLKNIEIQYNQILEALKNPKLPEEQVQMYEQTKLTLEKSKNELENNKKQVQIGIAQIDEAISTGKQEIENGKLQISNAKAEIDKNQEQLNSSKQSTNKQIQEAKQEIEVSKQKILDGEKELEENKKEFETKIKNAENELIDARAKIADIENPKWYILDRYSNIAYNSFIQDTRKCSKYRKSISNCIFHSCNINFININDKNG